MLKDTNGTTSYNCQIDGQTRAYSLYGASVSLSWDALFLAIGIPGRDLSYTGKRTMDSYPYNGAIRLFKRTNSTTSFTNGGVFLSQSTGAFFLGSGAMTAGGYGIKSFQFYSDRMRNATFIVGSSSSQLVAVMPGKCSYDSRSGNGNGRNLYNVTCSADIRITFSSAVSISATVADALQLALTCATDANCYVNATGISLVGNITATSFAFRHEIFDRTVMNAPSSSPSSDPTGVIAGFDYRYQSQLQVSRKLFIMEKLINHV